MRIRHRAALCALLLSSVATAAAFTGCGQPAFTERIVGGKDTPPGKWPWQVSIVYRNSHLCGGSLISRTWVASAAHCFPSYNLLANYQILLGAQNLTNTTSNALMVPVKSVFIHPSYNQDSNVGDISLIELKTQVTFTNYILPICIPSPAEPLSAGKMCWATGWGDVQSGVNLLPPQNLQEVELPLINATSCDDIYHKTYNIDPQIILISEDMVCAGYPEGKKDSCQGDSGGPLACKNGNTWFLTGIVSWGDDCAQPNRPGVYTKVSSFHSWIYQKALDLNTSTSSPPSTSAFASTQPTGTTITRKSDPGRAELNVTLTKNINSISTRAHGHGLHLSTGLLLATVSLSLLKTRDIF